MFYSLLRIEHLYPADLEALPFNIFALIKPKIAIFTTPNADFNILFENFNGMRHLDHKFEWSRVQFEDWSRNITIRFPFYSVYFLGVGQGVPGTEKFGCVSQVAVFTLRDNNIDIFENELESFGICNYM